MERIGRVERRGGFVEPVGLELLTALERERERQERKQERERQRRRREPRPSPAVARLPPSDDGPDGDPPPRLDVRA